MEWSLMRILIFQNLVTQKESEVIPRLEAAKISKQNRGPDLVPKANVSFKTSILAKTLFNPMI